MSTIYIDTLLGSDVTGDGSSERPYKTITFVSTVLLDGDTVIIEPASNLEDCLCYNDEETIVLENMTDVTFDFHTKTSTDRYSNLTWCPKNISPEHRCTLLIKNCNNVSIKGATFAQSPNELVYNHHIAAVRAFNSSNITLTNCQIVENGWESSSGHVTENITEGCLFEFDNCNETEITNLKLTRLNNSYNIPYSVVSVSGPCSYYITGMDIRNITSNNMPFRALLVKPGTRKVTVDGILVHNMLGDVAGSTVGIELDGSASAYATEFNINAGQFSNVHTGIKISNELYNPSYARRVKHCTFYKCLTGIDVSASYAEVYSLSIYGGSTTVTRNNEMGITVDVNTYGIKASNGAVVSCLNTIVTYCNTAFTASDASIITAEHIVWNGCENLSSETSNGKVQALQFIRKTDPRYEDLDADPWGYFMISNTSPCMDVGKNYGDPYMGNGPDIGAMERSDTAVSDLISYVSRAARYTDYIPMTNIDIDGMITQGLDTADTSIMSGREGSVIKDIAVKPLSGMLSPFVTELEQMRDNQSFLNFLNLDPDAADALASNVFVTRRKGSKATGIVRVFFDTAVDASIPAEFSFNTADGRVFYSLSAITMTEDEMSLNYDNGLYYMDVLVEADMEGTNYNVDAGDINSSFMTLPAHVVAVSNPYPFTDGTHPESNAELYAKIKDSITTRDLVTEKGIRYVLRDTFSDIQNIQIIGFGDPEMLRDAVLDDSIHIGGKVDIYMQLSTDIEDTYTFDPIYAENELNSTTFNKLPILGISKLEILDPGTEDITGVEIPASKWSLETISVKNRLSVYEKLVLKVDPMYEGYTVRMTFKWAENLKNIQNWILTSEHRVVCADLYAKHLFPAFISFSLYYHGEEEISGLQSALEDFITTHNPSEPLQSSDIIDHVYSMGSIHVVNPFTISAEIHMPDGSVKKVIDEDMIELDRIQCYMPGEITCTYLGTDETNNQVK